MVQWLGEASDIRTKADIGLDKQLNTFFFWCLKLTHLEEWLIKDTELKLLTGETSKQEDQTIIIYSNSAKLSIDVERPPSFTPCVFHTTQYL